MLRFDRGGIVALVLPAMLAGVATQASAREAGRDFPHGEHCPVHTPGPSADGDPFLFTATKTAALLTFLTCDNRSLTSPTEPPQGFLLDVSIDDLMVVERSVFNNPANRIPFADAVSLFGYGSTCYGGDTGVAVTSVFDKRRRFKNASVPFRENFEGRPHGWLLGNATFGVEGSDQGNQSLILARSSRPNGAKGNLCSVASVKVDHLVPGREYVLDFSWWVNHFDQDVFSTPVPALTFFIDPVPATW